MAGLTRSAVANYELGRSLPAEHVKRDLAKALGIDESAFKVEPTVEDFELQLRSYGPVEGLSDDEMAFIRLLRCAPPEDAIAFVKRLIDYFESVDDAFRFVDSEQAAKDLAKLYKAYRARRFQVGISPYSVTKVARFLAGEDD